MADTSETAPQLIVVEGVEFIRADIFHKTDNLRADRIAELEAERDALKAALRKIASWDVAYPEKSSTYGVMAVVTAREVIKENE